MAIIFLDIMISLALAALLYLLFTLSQRYLRIRSVGLPILFSPFGAMNPFWIVSQTYLKDIFALHYSYNGWQFFSRYELHEKYGDAFFIVSPGAVQLIIVDPLTVDDVQIRRKDFPKDSAAYAPLEILGPNNVTLNGEGWARHRKITVPPFNERNSALVWKESVLQAGGMLKVWDDSAKSELGGVKNTMSDTRALALNVLMAAGFGKRYNFEETVSGEAWKYEAMGKYRASLHTVLDHLYRAIMTSFLIGLPAWLMPESVLDMKASLSEVKHFILKMIEDDRAGIDERSIEGDNLMSALVRASESAAAGKEKSGLSDEEITGNLFIYNVAGHDATANTLAYAITMLSTDTEVQDWLREEIISELGGGKVEDWKYEETFPRLKRCLAVMFETLRLYCPVFFVPRYTADSFQNLNIQGKDYLIPPDTQITCNLAATHTLPAIWGADSLIWRPERWLDANGDLIEPLAGTFNPWTTGPRVCPGKKFSQVEFVAVITRLFQDAGVKIKREPGESYNDSITRAKDVVADSVVDVTLHMAHPERVRLVWEHT